MNFTKNMVMKNSILFERKGEKMDCGIVLEGGGSRGAYHMGAVKAILEKGYNITGITGTSIGAVNGAFIAQGDFEIGYKIWETIKYDTLFDIDEKKLMHALNKNLNFNIVKYMSRKFTEMIKNGGIDTKKMREFLNEYIDEDKIRGSNIKFGLVTYSLTDKKPYELFVEDIPKGMLKDYIMASSTLPGFKQQPLENKFYIDGGVYNNCPLNMLVDKDFKDIFVIRTGSYFKIKNIKNIRKQKDVTFKIIEPRNNLGNILNFESKTSNRLINIGYYDALKVLDNLDGLEYSFNSLSEEIFQKSLSEYNQEELNKIYELLSLTGFDSKKTLFETVIPILLSKIGFKEVKTYKDVVLALVEYIALKENIDQFKVYNFYDFLSLVKSKIRFKDKNRLDEVIYRFVKDLEF
ncbi:MAG: patatin-like phospholipase family protein [Clostridia bacterium]|nr:patatin-like phospholipase family protein [Clostridia bacterium]MDD4386788.1 patatin-like phospholipase family protein [Clostridia bacterium]